jgi:hypothetical protein
MVNKPKSLPKKINKLQKNTVINIMSLIRDYKHNVILIKKFFNKI